VHNSSAKSSIPIQIFKNQQFRNTNAKHIRSQRGPDLLTSRTDSTPFTVNHKNKINKFLKQIRMEPKPPEPEQCLKRECKAIGNMNQTQPD